MDCRSCGRAVPDGIFCTVCGTDQRSSTVTAHGALRRTERYAAHPDEPVMQAGILTTLLPHLDHDRVDEFRWALLAGFGVIILLYAGGLITAALLVATILVPLLYVLYLYEVRTYRDAPVPVFGLTLGAGAVLGVVVTAVANLARLPVPAIDDSPFGVSIDIGAFIVASVAIPIVRELVKPLPALVLRRRPEFTQTIDGLVFGVAAGLGFALGETIVQFAGVISSLGIRTDPSDWIYPLITVGALLPVLHGSSTGVITAALWHGGVRGLDGNRALLVGVAIASQIAFAGGSTLIAATGVGQLVVIAWQALLVAGLLLVMRRQLHRGMLEEAERFGFTRVTCPNCGETGTASAFCATCGMALSAATRPVQASITAEPARGTGR